ncbi:MAG: class I SAM-dependent methyltransferase [Leptolyngbyaceae cyanobacterium MO_188.B28]|nr:class I SAM-dependent methyltransferase [Leptolyngbyaceae cyanobacterium MO_188.B28]
MQVLHHYNSDHNVSSAQQIVPYIFDILQIELTSVIDIGCGLAQWLRVFKEHGVDDVLGIDGSHVPLDKLNIDISEFRACDLRKLSVLEIGKRFDLLLCLEVAEHLQPEYAHQFIQTLVLLSDRIIFSAAVPNQTGENHFNEQYPDYWAGLFSQYGYRLLDPFREKFWQDEKVNWWYRQNMFLVVKNELAGNYSFSYNGNVYIHPKLLELRSSLAKKPKTNDLRVAFKHLIKKVISKIS